MADQADSPGWIGALPDKIAASISDTLQALAVALRDEVGEESKDIVARRAQVLRGHTH
jgi:hypothetical protein